MSTSTKTMINIKADKEVKEEAQKIVKEMGLTLSAFVNGALRELIRTKEVRFTAKKNVMTPELEATIAQARRDYKKGDYYGPFDSTKNMDVFLDSLNENSEVLK